MQSSSSSFGRITRDILDLCELQMQLLSVDSQEATRKAVRAGIIATTGVVLGGSAVTVAMLGGGYLVHELAGWSVGASLLAIAGATCFVVIVLLAIASKAIQGATYAMAETKSEFVENLKWIKAVLVTPESSPRNQLRKEDFPPYVPQSRQDNASRNHKSRLNER